MAGDKLTWTFELLDKMSGPLRRISGAMRGLTFDKIRSSVGRFAEEVRAIPTAMSLIAGLVVNELRPLGRAVAFALEPVTDIAKRAFSSIAARAAPVVAAVAERFQSLVSTVGARLAPIGEAVSSRFSSVVGAVQSALSPIASVAQSAMSKASGAVSRALDSVITKLKPIGARIASVFSAVGARLAPVGAEIGKLIGKIAAPLGNAIKGMASKLAGSLGSTLGKIAPVIGKGILAAASAFLAVGGAAAVAIGGLAIAGAKFVGETLVFKEDALTAFEAITGSKTEAQRIMAMAVKFAAVTPFGTGDVVTMAKSLMTRGFKASELENLMKGVGDVGAMLGTEKMDSVINALGKMRSTGKLGGEALEMLADAGVNSKLVLGSLAKQLGKTEKQIRAMISAGQITDAQGIQATMDAIAQGLSGGTLGGAMEKKSKTLSGLFSTLSSIPEELVIAADMSGALEPIKNLVKMVTSLFSADSAGGKRLIAMLELVGKAVGEVFGSISEDELSKAMTGILNVLEMLVPLGAEFFKSFISGMGSVLGPTLEWLSTLAKNPEMMRQLTEGILTFAKVAGQMLAFGIVMIGLLVAAWGPLLAAVGKVANALKSIVGYLADIGKVSKPPADKATPGPAKNAFGPSLSSFIPTIPGATPPKTDVMTSQPWFAALNPGAQNGNQSPLDAWNAQHGQESPLAAAPAIQPAAGRAPIVDAGNALAARREVNVTVAAPIVTIHMSPGEDGAAAGKAAAESFSTQLGSALKGIAGEMGG